MDYKKTLASNNRLYGSKKSSPKKSSPKKSPIVSSNSMLNALSSDEILETIVLNMYKLEKDRNYSNSEILSIITRIDYGRLFSMALVKINLDLQVTTLVDNFVKKYEELINEKQLNQNTCRIISKKYSDRDDLLFDNNIVIYFDSQYDKTNYNILNKLKTQKDTLSPEEFKVLLTTTITKGKGKGKELDEAQITKEVNTLLEGNKRVENGDYAILILPRAEESEAAGSSESEITPAITREIGRVESADINTAHDLHAMQLEIEEMRDEARNRKARAIVSKSNEPSKSVKTVTDVKDKPVAEYFVRKDNVWIKDNEIVGKDVVVDDNKIFCSLQKGCLINNVDETCDSLDTVEKKLDENTLQSIYSEFDKTYGDEEAKLREDIEKNLVLSIERIQLLNIMAQSEFYKYDLEKRILGDSIVADNVLIDTPYEKRTGPVELVKEGDAWYDKHTGHFVKYIEFSTDEGYTEEGFKINTRAVLNADMGQAIL